MYTSSLPASLLLAVTASLLSSRAAADSCSAVGSLTTNSAGFGEGGTTNAYSNGITLFKGSTVVGNWTQCNDCSSVCSVSTPKPHPRVPVSFPPTPKPREKTTVSETIRLRCLARRTSSRSTRSCLTRSVVSRVLLGLGEGSQR